jgi:hypothetical protein
MREIEKGQAYDQRFGYGHGVRHATTRDVARSFFAEMRSWLDRRAIEPVNFQTIAKGEFEFCFKNFADARRFSEQFT